MSIYARPVYHVVRAGDAKGFPFCGGKDDNPMRTVAASAEGLAKPRAKQAVSIARAKGIFM
jgi:hypothetical protein